MVGESDFLDFVSGVLAVAKDQLALDTAYGSISQWDSVMHLRLVMELENKYHVDFPLEQIPNLKTLGSLYAVVNSSSR